jgi:hypothetical protein
MRTLRGIRIALGLLGVLALLAVVALALLIKGDPPPEPGFRITNQTDTG